jgi:hypothetical protein
MDALPTRKDINVYNSLDEQSAEKAFLGKELKEAEVMFREGFLSYQEDLMWMGPRAFCFYVQAAIAYLLSPASARDCEAVGSFPLSVEFQLEHYQDQLGPITDPLRNAVAAILSEFDRYDCGGECCNLETRLQLRARYERLHELLLKRAHGNARFEGNP